MISTTSAFATANAQLAKQPVWVLEIAGYSRAFASKSGLGSFEGLPPDFVVQEADNGVLGGPASSVVVTMPNAITAGDILIAIGRGNANTSGSETITDTAGNTWTPIFHDVATIIGHKVSIWRAVAVGAAAGNQVTFGAPGSLHSHMWVFELPPQYSGTLATHTSGVAFSTFAGEPIAATSDGNVLDVPLASNASDEDLFMISIISPSGLQAGVSIGMLVSEAGPTVVDATQFLSSGAFSTIVQGCYATGYDWLTSLGDLKLTVSDLDGGADISDLSFTVQDRSQQLTADIASFIFEGKNCRLLAGFIGMAVNQFATLFTGQIDTVETTNGNTEYTFTASDVNIKKLTQKIYTTGDDGFAIDSKHPKTLSAHPLDILVSALEQAGVPSTKIDTAKIDFYRDTVYNGLLYEFTLTSAPTAKDFIEAELMKPLGMYIWVNNLGLVSVNAFYPALSGNANYTPPTPPAMTLTADQIISNPLEQVADLKNQVVFQFDDDGSGNGTFLAEEIVDYDESITKYGLVGEQDIQSKGMRSAFQGYFMAAFIGRLIALRYGLKPIVLDPVTLIWSACTLEPGDIVAVTDPFIPDRSAGVLGVTAKFFEVMDRNWKFMSGQVELKLLEINLALYKQFLITPNAETTYAIASGTDQGKYLFQCGANGKYSTGAAANTLG